MIVDMLAGIAGQNHTSILGSTLNSGSFVGLQVKWNIERYSVEQHHHSYHYFISQSTYSNGTFMFSSSSRFIPPLT